MVVVQSGQRGRRQRLVKCLVLVGLGLPPLLDPGAFPGITNGGRPATAGVDGSDYLMVFRNLSQPMCGRGSSLDRTDVSASFHLATQPIRPLSRAETLGYSRLVAQRPSSPSC